MRNKFRQSLATRRQKKPSSEPISSKISRYIDILKSIPLKQLIQQDPKRFIIVLGVSFIALLLINWPESSKPDVEQERRTLDLSHLSAGDTASKPARFRKSQKPSTTNDIEPESANNEELMSADKAPVEKMSSAPSWQTYQVTSGDNLSKIFYRAGLTDRDVYLFTKKGQDTKAFTRLDVGDSMHFIIDNKRLIEAKLVKDKLHYYHASLDETGDNYVVEDITLTPDVRYKTASAVIKDSLFMSATRAGISQRLTMELAEIFGWDIDFALDIRPQDQFKIVYEELYLNDEFIGEGDIVAASFDNRNRHLEAVQYTKANGDKEYHAPDGRSMRKAFLRTPVDFKRISSHFNLKRKHPVLHTIRAHKGTDYAASRGTPIRAAGDGRVTFAGRKGGWGKVIIIQHGERYKTLYAHQNNFAKGIKKGSRVKQGQVIGYVGSTGLASGPHLHYEFYVDGKVRNPVTVKLPEAAPIASSERDRFILQTAGLLAKLREGEALSVSEAH